MPIFRPSVPVTIEYDSRGKRVRKAFDDAYKARNFYVAKDKLGKHPRVLKVRAS